MSVSESDKFSDLDEEESTREGTIGILGLSIPDLIQTYDDEEVFSGRDPLGEFEQDHVPPHLRYQSPEPVQTPSPKRKRGGSTDEPSSNERGVRGRATTTLPTFERFNSAGYHRYQPPAGREAFQSPLRTRAGVRSLERERGVSAERLSLPPRRRLASHRQGRPRSQHSVRISGSVVRSFAFCDKRIMMSWCGSIQTTRQVPCEG
jgi:hypothetical protein